MYRTFKLTATPALLLAGCVGLVQYHAMDFWSAFTEAETGWLWALLLEGGALWLWALAASPWGGARELVRWATIITAAVMTLVFLAGPLYEITDPLVRSIFAAPAGNKQPSDPRIKPIEARMETLAISIAAAEKDWRLRVADRERIEKEKAKIEELGAKLDGIIEEGRSAAAAARLTWRKWGVILIESLALILLHLVSIGAASSISRRLRTAVPVSEAGDNSNGYRTHPVSEISEITHGAEREITDLPAAKPEIEPPQSRADSEISEISPPSPEATPAPEVEPPELPQISHPEASQFPKSVSVSAPAPRNLDPFTLRTLLSQLRAVMERPGFVQKDFCGRIGISEPDLTCFINLADPDKKASRNPSRAAVAKLIAELGGEREGNTTQEG